MNYSQVSKLYIWANLNYSRSLRKSPKILAQREINMKFCDISITNSLEFSLYDRSQLFLNLKCSALPIIIAKTRIFTKNTRAMFSICIPFI